MIAEKYQGAAMRSAAHDQETGSSACSSMMNQDSYTCSMLFYLRGSNTSSCSKLVSHVRVLNFDVGDDYVELDDIFASVTK